MVVFGIEMGTDALTREASPGEGLELRGCGEGASEGKWRRKAPGGGRDEEVDVLGAKQGKERRGSGQQHQKLPRGQAVNVQSGLHVVIGDPRPKDRLQQGHQGARGEGEEEASGQEHGLWKRLPWNGLGTWLLCLSCSAAYFCYARGGEGEAQVKESAVPVLEVE